MKSSLLIGLTVIILILGDNLWKILEIDGLYFTLHAWAWVTITLYCVYKEKETNTIQFKLREKGLTSFKIALCFFLLAVNDLIVELFFDGTKVEINAYIYLLVAIVYLISTARWKKTRQ